MINADSRNSSAKELNGQHWEIDPYRPNALAVYDGRTKSVKRVIATARSRKSNRQLVDKSLNNSGMTVCSESSLRRPLRY